MEKEQRATTKPFLGPVCTPNFPWQDSRQRLRQPWSSLHTSSSWKPQVVGNWLFNHFCVWNKTHGLGEHSTWCVGLPAGPIRWLCRNKVQYDPLLKVFFFSFGHGLSNSLKWFISSHPLCPTASCTPHAQNVLATWLEWMEVIIKCPDKVLLAASLLVESLHF